MPILTYPTVRQASIFAMFSQQSEKPDHWRAAGKTALRQPSTVCVCWVTSATSKSGCRFNLLEPQTNYTHSQYKISMSGSLAEIIIIIKKITTHNKHPTNTE